MIAGTTEPTNDSTIQKWCYNNSAASCNTYGALYNWDEAMGYTTTPGTQGICAPGWHIPTDAEQHTLDNYLATSNCDGNRSGWGCTPAGTALKSGGSSNFNELLSGYRVTNGLFYNQGLATFLWSSNYSGTSAWYRWLQSTETGVSRNLFPKTFGHSVRCVQTPDTTPPSVPTPTDTGDYSTSTSLTFYGTPSDSGSGLSDCYGQILDNTSSTYVINGASVGTDGDYTITGTNGHNYTYRYYCRDTAGNQSSYSPWTDGIIVDTTAPTVPDPTDQGTYSSMVSINFYGTPSDDESGLSQCYGRIYDDTAGSYYMNETAVGVDGDYNFNGTDGHTYRYQYSCTNNAGLSSAYTAWTDGITVDTAAPTVTTPTDE